MWSTHETALCLVLYTASPPYYMWTLSLLLLAPSDVLLGEGKRICSGDTSGGEWRAGDLDCARDLQLVGGAVRAVDWHGFKAGVQPPPPPPAPRPVSSEQ